MTGWKIFAQSVRLVFANLPQALRISLLPYILAGIAMVWFFRSNAAYLGQTGQVPTDMSGFNLPSLLVFVVVSTLVYMWIAVAWHRFVLVREEAPGWLPAFHGDRVLAYLGRGLLLGLVMVGVFLVLGMFIGFASMAGGAPLLMLGSLAVVFVGMVVFYRFCAILPAAALGQPIGMGEAWRRTRGASGAVLLLALISTLAGGLIQAPAEMGGAPGAPLSLLYMLVTNWLQFMVGLSILTTIYGHYVEGRSID